jgi:hypothetical protein
MVGTKTKMTLTGGMSWAYFIANSKNQMPIEINVRSVEVDFSHLEPYYFET